jgi:RNA polymerase sigma-70 factor
MPISAMTFDQFAETFCRTIERLYARSGADAWKLSLAEFSAALHRGVSRRFADVAISPPIAEQIEFLESLHVEDLALATACLAGQESAWEHFVERYRPVVASFARATIGDRSQADEVTDSIWADLYGFRTGDGSHRAPLEHYHGRSGLASWLRVVVARREADAWRVSRRTESLDGNGNGARRGINASAEHSDPDRNRLIPMLRDALDDALAALDSRDKLRLSYYYVQELTLAQIAAIAGEHESTVSRSLARTRVEIRRAVERVLKRKFRLSDDQIGRCFDYAVEDWAFDLTRALAKAK